MWGLSSYLLIGFWHHKDSANAASVKAFITNRVGDMGMILGIAGCFAVFNSVSMPEILSKLSTNDQAFFRFGGDVTINAYVFICGCFLIGAMAKSAQFGLHVWLPDAMEGPTPVSALIHAATMVTAGVFLLIRLSFLFEYAPGVRVVILCLGAITALFSAIVGLLQKDIKRIIAYSTCSQLGYMFMACGVSMYSAALFHLVTHAFFKALLFLSAGSVIHVMSGEQNIRKMSGLYRRIPVTYAFVWVGSLSLAGAPFFAGYYSKDWILEALYINSERGGSFAPYIIGIMSTFLTAFYSWRLILLVFHGNTNADERVLSHVHEPPLSMQFPQLVLAIGAVLAGVGLMEFFTEVSYINKAYAFKTETNVLPSFVHILPIMITLAGGASAVWVYHKYRKNLGVLLHQYKKVCGFIQSGMGVNELYRSVVIKPFHSTSGFVYHYVEKGLIDRYGSNGLALMIYRTSKLLRRLQSGRVGDYASMMIVGLIIILGYMVVVR